jgi:hypothetical protein
MLLTILFRIMLSLSPLLSSDSKQRAFPFLSVRKLYAILPIISSQQQLRTTEPLWLSNSAQDSTYYAVLAQTTQETPFCVVVQLRDVFRCCFFSHIMQNNNFAFGFVWVWNLVFDVNG